jgi:oxygen-independent coproporphyrinogen-3 oxidase
VDPGFGVYVHIPFCLHRCHYCDFNTYEGLDALHSPYVDALVESISRHDGATRPATSVYFGGGTPTLLPPQALARILAAVRNRTGLEPDSEVTVEANPETVDVRVFEELLGAGFNRVSIGVQSLAPNILEKLGRTHSAGRALQAIADARTAGFTDVNADLIYGSPWETAADWRRTLDGVIESSLDHISAYSLMVEEGTPLATLVATGRVPDVDPDLQADRHEVASELLEVAGFDRYEISNWARPDRASRHNVLYWSAGDYLGFGAGAHAHLAGTRSWSVRLPRDFIARVHAGDPATDGYETLEADARAGEALMLGLRLASGIELTEFVERFGESPLVARKEELSALESAGLVRKDGGRLRLTSRGTLLANEALCRIL